jgi:hypothetical protein
MLYKLSKNLGLVLDILKQDVGFFKACHDPIITRDFRYPSHRFIHESGIMAHIEYACHSHKFLRYI